MKNQGYEDSKLVYGDSDSVLTSIPSAETTTEALIAGKKASEYTKKQYDIFMKDEFNADEHLMDVEIESYASAIFFSRKSNDLDNAEEAAKKRYAQIIEWDEDEGFLGYKANPKPKLKGFDAIRSDTSQITKEVQEEVLRIILEEDEPKDEVYEYLEKKIEEIKSGEHLEKLGIPESINEELSYYGDENRRCVPKIRGAKYATQNFEGVNIEKGGAPKTYRINSISQDYPQVYEAETPEDGDKVDAVSVESVSDLPVEDIEFDYDTMLDKTLKSSLEPILRTMEWSWNDVVTDGRQQGLEAFA
jgi:DNA polymerase elongation subunit (family B)